MAIQMSDEDNKRIETAKKKYADAQAAGDKAGMEAAHNEAEAVRANYGFSGGADGSEVWKEAKSVPATPTATTSYKDDLNKLTEAQRKARVASLKKARTQALANLDAQEKEIKPTYQNARNLTSASSQTGARSFGEFLANRGLSNSGAAAQGEMNRQSALQNNLGNINTAEANAYRDIANQRTQINNNYISDLANANAAIDANYYNNLLNYNEQQRQYIQGLQNQALGQYADDYQAQINNLLAQGYSPNSLEVLQLQALRGNKIGSNLSNATNPSIALQSIQNGNINYNNAAALGWTVQQAQEYYNNLLAQAQAQAEQQAFENYIKQQQLINATKQTNYNINKPYYNPNSGTTEKTIAPSSTAQKAYIESTFANKDIYGDITGYDKNGILNYVQQENQSGRMSDSDAVNILYNYGMKDIADQLIGG